MKPLMRIAVPVALALGASACSLGGLLGGGAKAPAILYTLTPEAPAPGEIVRASAPGEAVTVATPVVPKELRTIRVPVQIGATQVAYVKDLQWVDTPDRLFRDLVAETVRRTTSRVVLDSKQAALDPGLLVSGELSKFGYEEAEGAVLVRYDAALSTAGGTQVQTRRFEARVPADGTAATVAPGLNQAANQVALEVARWIGG